MWPIIEVDFNLMPGPGVTVGWCPGLAVGAGVMLECEGVESLVPGRVKALLEKGFVLVEWGDDK